MKNLRTFRAALWLTAIAMGVSAAQPIRGFLARMEGAPAGMAADSRHIPAEVTGRPSYVPGLAGQALRLERGSVSYPASDALDVVSGAVSFWLRPVDWGDAPVNFVPVFAVDNTGKGSGWKLLLYYHHDSSGAVWDFRAMTPANREIICQMKIDELFRRGEWNHVTLSWTNQELEMTCNGSPVHRQSYGLPIKLQGHPQDRICFMPDDFWRIRSQWTTELDEIQVFPSSIDEGTAHNLFLRHRTPPPTDDAHVTVPMLKQPVVLDGRLEEREWNDASRVPVMTAAHSHRLYTQFPAWAMVKRDADTLYVAFDIDAPGDPAVGGVSGEYYQDIYKGDEAELVAASPNGFRQYFIAPNGTWACRDENAGWLPDHKEYRHAAQRHKGGWSAEMAIPLVELEQTTTLCANFGIHRASAPDILDRLDRWIAWNATSETEVFARNFGQLTFSSTPSRIESLGACGEGRYDFGATSGATLTVTSLLTGQAVVTLAPGQQKTHESPGHYRLSVSAPGLFWSTDAEVTERLALQCACDSSKGVMEFRVQLRDAPGLEEKLLSKRLSIRAEILDEAGRILAQSAKTATLRRETLTVPFAEPKPGGYILRAAVEGLDTPLVKQLSFTVPDRSFLGNRLGMEETIPQPWRELTIDGRFLKGAFHRYEFDDGPFPHRAWSQESQVLQAFIGLTGQANGHSIQWQKSEVSQWESSGVTLARTGKLSCDDGLALLWSVTMDIDGLLRYRLKLCPPEGSPHYRINSLAAEFELNPNQALAALTPAFSLDWLTKGEATDKLFIGATASRGFCAFTDDDTNYLHKPGAHPFRLTQRDGKVVLHVDFIQKDAELTCPVEYSFALMATPGKPPRPDWRRLHSEGWLAYPGQNWAVRGWTSEKAKMGYLRGYLLTTPLNPTAAKADIAHHASLGISDVTYTCNNIIPSNNPIHDYFAKAWARPVHGEIQGISQSRDLDGTPYMFGIPVCDNHPGYRDYLCYYIAKNMDELGYKGVYFDFGGDASTDVPSEGSPIPNVLTRDRLIERTNVFGTRELYRRLRNIIKSRHQDGVIYSHSWRVFHPAWLSFADVVNPGEEFMHEFPRNRNVYASDREFSPLELWRTVYNSETLGVAVQFLAMLYWIPEMKEYLKMGHAKSFPLRMRESRALITMCLLHDVQISGGGYAAIDGWWPIQDALGLEKAVFHSCHTQHEYTGNNGALVSYYSWSTAEQRLLLVGNLTGQPVQTRLNGLPPNATLKEPWPTPGVFHAKDALELAPYGFRILLLNQTTPIKELHRPATP